MCDPGVAVHRFLRPLYTEYIAGLSEWFGIGIAFLESKECNSNSAQFHMTIWRGVSHATPEKSRAKPSRHSNATGIDLELELAELEFSKLTVIPSNSKRSTMPTPRHSNAARIARRQDWRIGRVHAGHATLRCHITFITRNT